MRLLVCAVAACAALVAHANSAAAAPVGRISWDDCTPIVVNKSWAGPGIYVHVISSTGLENGTQSVRYFVDTAAFPDAWIFPDQDFPSWCHPVPGLTALGTSCPAAPVTSSQYHYIPWLTQPRGSYIVQIGLDPAASYDPGQRYTLCKISFDHSHSVVGYSPPSSGDCGDVERSVCFASGMLVDLGDGPHQIAMDSEFVQWQAEPGAICMGAVPARASTWGQIKSQYH
jgi:hypothetical protein